MMRRYHINDKGEPAVCEAQSSMSCRYGGEDHTEAESIGGAREFAEQRNAEKAADAAQSESRAELAGIQRYISENASTQEEADKLLKQHKKIGNAAFIVKHGVQVHGVPDAVELENNTSSGQGSALRKQLPPLQLRKFADDEAVMIFNAAAKKNAKSSEDLIETTDEVVDEDEDLGVVTYRNTGILADKGYFSPTTIRGKINRQELVDNPEAYKKLGFDDLEDGGDLLLTGPHEISDDVSDRYISERDMSMMCTVENAGDSAHRFTEEEVGTVHHYTDHGYEDINSALYAGDDRNDVENRDILDSALAKGPQRQRKLYRFVSTESPFIIERTGHSTSSEWADETFAPGQEVKFDGYQSTSSNPKAVQNFLGPEGVVFEIVTPEGRNVTEYSQYSAECEVMLPRGSKYVVADTKKDVSAYFSLNSKNPSTDESMVVNSVSVVRLIAVNDDGEIKDGSN